VGTNNSAFDEKVKAIEVALNNLSFQLKMFTGAAILVDSEQQFKQSLPIKHQKTKPSQNVTNY
jgi:hypothetical protein